MGRFYPTLVSDKYAATVNFYEDYFGMRAVVETDGYALLKGGIDDASQIAVFDVNHPCMTKYSGTAVQGLILTVEVESVDSIYDQLYMEGVEMCKELGTDVMGHSHFVVRDPNGVLVSVSARLGELVAA